MTPALQDWARRHGVGAEAMADLARVVVPPAQEANPW